jgi:uncharacterized lipoprotein
MPPFLGRRSLIVRKSLALCLLLIVVAGTFGCARAARDTSGFATLDGAVVDAPFEHVWTSTRSALRKMDLELYTRDKRGVFMAYSKMERHLFVPHRQKFTILLEAEGNTTRVSVETVDQVYGVTLLTHPDWHDRKTTDNSTALAIIAAIQTEVAPPAAP